MARESFDHKKIEQEAQAKWAELDLYTTDLSDEEKEKYYLLFEFPYPSGDLHIGHWYAFALTDIYARKLRMEGKNVLFPMGFDAFGLPAENAAIKRGLDPKKWTYENMERMRAQIRTMGASMDWSKEVVTCDPSYYKWTQWLFTKFLEHDLAERKEANVKWCPNDRTVLANEQVIDGKCERCGHEVEDRMLTQWFLKITKYADRLLKDLDDLAWPEEIKDAQRAWIGKSEGAKLAFVAHAGGEDVPVDIFTTRPDTLFGATYLVLAPEHAQLETLLAHAKNPDAVRAYQKETGKRTERERSENKEKTGVVLEGITATNPATKQEIPVYVADYVLASYGTGAVMAVPAHDERDFEFAKKYRLPVKAVVTPIVELNSYADFKPTLAFRIEEGEDVVKKQLELVRQKTQELLAGNTCYVGDGELVNSGDFTGRNNREALWDIVAFAGGERTENYRIRDWSVGRQRYWGCPIPVVYDPEGKPHAIPSEHLPWLLPEDVDFTPGAAGEGKSPLASSKELHERVTRLFGEGWTPEYDTLDTFVDSSWYFFRYLDPKDEHDFSDQRLLAKWMPVDRYSGGSEHTTMHLLYARFFTKVMHDLALSPVDEPFRERFNRGIILGPDGAKMSKSKGNVINPDEVVEKFGADAVRMYLAFIGPYNEPGHYPWNLDGTFAMSKFLDRVVKLQEAINYHEGFDGGPDMENSLRKAIEKVTSEIDRFKFNTAISAIMILVKDLEGYANGSNISPNSYYVLLKLLAPFAPHLTEYLWTASKAQGTIHTSEWPNASEFANIENRVLVVVQVNGKKKTEIWAWSGMTEEEALQQAIQSDSVKASLNGLRPKRVIYVPGRILNLVV